jgi:pimeloyl-ACP methyl ester carboxylesterase
VLFVHCCGVSVVFARRIPRNALTDHQPNQLLACMRDVIDCRLMAYYTFATGREQSSSEDLLHPIIYLHGFPGSGVEGRLCAKMADSFGCRVYGVDRPGFGSSAPLATKTGSLVVDMDEYVDGCVDQIFDLVKAKQWNEFSVIGVSGGGPYALAILERYLTLAYPESSDATTMDDDSKDPPVVKGAKTEALFVPKLKAVAVVAGVCCAGGTEGMLNVNKQLISFIGSGSIFGRLALKVIFAMQSFMVSHFPDNWLNSVIKGSSRKDLPKSDQELMDEDDSVVDVMIEDVQEAFHQGSAAAVLEAHVLFRENQGFFESLTRKWHCLTTSTAASKGTTANNSKMIDLDSMLPQVTIYQGLDDVHVPPCHSRYVHEVIFGGEGATLREYPNLGHLSLIVRKADEYIHTIASRCSADKKTSGALV